MFTSMRLKSNSTQSHDYRPWFLQMMTMMDSVDSFLAVDGLIWYSNLWWRRQLYQFKFVNSTLNIFVGAVLQKKRWFVCCRHVYNREEFRCEKYLVAAMKSFGFPPNTNSVTNLVAELGQCGRYNPTREGLFGTLQLETTLWCS